MLRQGLKMAYAALPHRSIHQNGNVRLNHVLDKLLEQLL